MNDAFLAGQRVLVVVPHADDEALGCAGTLARIKQLGGEVYCLLGTYGGIRQYIAGANGLLDDRMRVVTGDERRSEFSEVMDLLGVDEWAVMFGDEYHIALDALPLRDVIAKIEHDGPLSIEQLRPSLLLMPARSFNQDHEMLFRACLAATRPSVPGRRHVVPNVLIYDNGTAHWAEATDRFHPNFYVDISEFIDVKRKALGTYVSQLPVDTRDDEAQLDSYSRTYGTHVSVRFAEAFHALRLAV